MQLRLHPRSNKKNTFLKLIMRTILGLLVFFLLIFLVDKIEMPSPNKLIKQEISNEKLIILK